MKGKEIQKRQKKSREKKATQKMVNLFQVSYSQLLAAKFPSKGISGIS